MNGTLRNPIVSVLVLAVTIACGIAAGQTAVRAPRDPQPLTFAVKDAPENLVYRVFFNELVSLQRLADEMSSKGQDPKSLRTLFQRVFLLSDEEHQALTSVASGCIATLDDTRSRTTRLVAELKQSEDRPRVQEELLRLRGSGEVALAEGVLQLRLKLGADRFAWLDQVVRRHVVPNLTFVPAPPRVASPLEGN